MFLHSLNLLHCSSPSAIESESAFKGFVFARCRSELRISSFLMDVQHYKLLLMEVTKHCVLLVFFALDCIYSNVQQQKEREKSFIATS
jgi:hypothetical protein